MAASITLTILNGKLQGKSYTYDSRTICWVGRQDNCNIQFPEISDYEKVSRLHCLIDIDPPKISIRDFNSKQGTYVNSVLIGRRNSGAAAPQNIKANIKPIDKNLESGNIITLGDVHIKVTINGEQPDYNPPPIPKPPNLMRMVADKAIEFIKIAWGVPVNNSSSKSSSDVNAIGGYKIVKEIGAGGYGKVFLAENAKKEQIAIKVMLAEVVATPKKVKRFEREIDNAKALNHPNVTRLVDNGFDPQNNCLYYAMEYCAGDNLSVFMQKMGGILPLDLAKRLIFQILDGLEYTHNAEIPYVRLADSTFGEISSPY